MLPLFKYNRLLLSLVLILALSACRKNNQTPSWDIDVTAPLVKTSLTIRDAVSDSLLAVQPDSSVHLIFDNTIFELNLDTLLDIPDTSLTETFSLPFGNFAFGPGETIYTISDTKAYGVNGAQLTDLVIREGQVFFSLSSSIPQPHEVHYTIVNSALYNNGNLGAPFTTVVNIPAGSQSNPAVVSSSFPLDGYYINMRGSGGNSSNQLETEMVILNSLGSDTAFIGQGDNANVTSTFSGIVPQYAKGYFGSQVFDMDPETANLSVFDMILGGTLDIDAISVELDIINGIGVDAEMTVQQLSAINTSNNSTVALNHSMINNPIHLDRAQENWNLITPSIWTTALNEQNSNIDQMIENLPDASGFEMDLFINPLGNVSGGNDFFHYDHPFKAVLRAELPLCLIANDLTLADTVSYTVYEDSVAGKLNYGKFYVFATNTFPLDASVQVFILDNGVVTDSVVSDQTIFGADEGGPAVTSRVTLELSADQIESLYGENIQLIIRTKFNTTQANPAGGHLKIYDYHRIDLQLTGDFGYRVELE